MRFLARFGHHETQTSVLSREWCPEILKTCSTAREARENLGFCMIKIEKYSTTREKLPHFMQFSEFSPTPTHFEFSATKTRSHPLTLSIPSSTINPYRHSFFVNTPFLWNSIPHLILKLSNRSAFHSALRRFLVV